MDINNVEIVRLILDYSLTRMAIFVLGFIVLLFFISSLFKISRSKEYRRIVTDMYVAGTIRNLAKSDGICLEEEEKEFKLWLKKERIRDIPLDKAIEEDIKEKNSEKIIDSLNKKEKK